MDPKLVGDINETNIFVNSICTKALLDTGSCVSVVSQSFYNDNLSQITIQPLTHILNIECADGNNLPYTGYIEVEISTGEDLPKANSHTCLLLATPDTKLSERTPVILCTNILNELLNEC